MTIELGPLADRLNQTHIIIPIDLASVLRLVPGGEVSMLADGGLEIYVVQRDTGTVRSIAVSADMVTIRATNP